MSKPSTLAIEGSGAFSGTPEVTEVHYDLRVLRISLDFAAVHHPVYVSFEGVCGFRVLDEGDLLEFWDAESRASGWLWRIKDGGWFSLESAREGFLSGLNGGYKEYLVVGTNDCVSVIATDEPKIEAPKP